MVEEEEEKTCGECNWFETRETFCNKHHKQVSHNAYACDDFWEIVRPDADERFGG